MPEPYREPYSGPEAGERLRPNRSAKSQFFEEKHNPSGQWRTIAEMMVAEGWDSNYDVRLLNSLRLLVRFPQRAILEATRLKSHILKAIETHQLAGAPKW